MKYVKIAIKLLRAANDLQRAAHYIIDTETDSPITFEMIENRAREIERLSSTIRKPGSNEKKTTASVGVSDKPPAQGAGFLLEG